MEITNPWGGGWRGGGQLDWIHSDIRRGEFKGSGGWGNSSVCVVVLGETVAWWEVPLRLVTQHYSDCETIGDGRRANPSCRPWKGRKTRFKTGRVLALCWLRSLAFIKKPGRGGSSFVQLPFLSPLYHTGLALFFPEFLHSSDSFLFLWECVRPHSAMWLQEIRRAHWVLWKLKGLHWLLGTGPAQRLEWIVPRYSPFLVPAFEKKLFQELNLHYTDHLKLHMVHNASLTKGIGEHNNSESDVLFSCTIQEITWRCLVLTCILHFHWRWVHTSLC